MRLHSLKWYGSNFENYTWEGVLSIQVRQHPKLIGNPIQSLFEGLEKLPTYALSRNNEFIWNADGETLLRFDDL